MECLRNDKYQRLTRDQKIGLKHYDDLLTKILPEEAKKIVELIEKQVKRIFGDDVQQVPVGAYRRGQPECKEIVICVTHKEFERKLPDLALALENTTPKFLIDRLGGEVRKNANGSEFLHGICKLPDEGSLARKFSIKVYPPH